MKISGIGEIQYTTQISQGDYIRTFDKLSEVNKSDNLLESALKQFCQILIRNKIISSPTDNIGIHRQDHVYILTHESKHLYHIEYAHLIS